MNKTILIAFVIALSASCNNNSNKSSESTVNADSSSVIQNTVDDTNSSDVNSLRAQNIEKAAMELMKHPVVLEAKAQGLKSYQDGELKQKPDGIKYAQSAIDETVALACTYLAMGVAPDPAFLWLYAAPRTWHGYTFPGTRWYADNVDTRYCGLRVDDKSTYEINIKFEKKHATQISFMLWDWLMYEKGIADNTDIPMGTFVIDQNTKYNEDGSVTLTIGPEPANGASNYIQSKPGATQVYMREIRGDGSVTPVRLSVKRIKGEAPAKKSMDELAKEAAVIIASGVKATHMITTTFGQLSENKISPIRIRWKPVPGSEKFKMSTDEVFGPDKAVGFIGSGLFNLKEDEALVMTLNMLGTEYLSLNTYRPFLVSPEHVYSSSSLNNFQAKPNEDGSYTFVIARKEPGLYNWVDVQGIPYGYFTFRWQSLTKPVSATLKTAVQQVKVVKLNDLKKTLPASTKWVTPEERKAQREERARQYKLRSLGTPCEVGGELDKMY
jgi:hypothetical protein